MRRIAGSFLCVTALTLCDGITVLAQVERPPRQVRGLFGSPAPRSDSHETFDFSLSVLGAYDDNILADQAVGADPRTQQRGSYSAMTGGFAFDRIGRFLDVGATGGTSVRYYPQLADLTAFGTQGGLGVSVHRKGTRLSVNGNAAYSPFYSFTPSPNVGQLELGDVRPMAVDAAVYRRDAVNYGGRASLEQSLGSRSSLSFDYGGQRTDFRGDATHARSQTGSGRFRHNVAKGLGLRLGYELQTSEFASSTDAPKIVNHVFDVGVDYSRLLSKTRRTTSGINVGSSMVEYQNVRQYHLTGDAYLTREIGQTWSASLAYRRGIAVADGFRAPFFADTVNVNVQGHIHRKLDLRSTLGYSNGELGLTGRTSAFDTYSASGRLRFAVTRLVAVYGEYINYAYAFTDRSNLPEGFPSRINRHGVRVGVSIWVPVYR